MQPQGGGHIIDFGTNRGGFGGGYQDRGRGRAPPRHHSWKRKDEGKDEDKGKSKTTQDSAEKHEHDQEQELLFSKWEASQDKQAKKQDAWGAKAAAGGSSEGTSDKPGSNPQRGTNDPRVACERCGMFNHSTQGCRRQFCERCGFANHSTFDCKKCLPWNYGPELCATQVEDQSLFFIDECIDPRVAKEKSSTAVISVVSGDVSAKLIEMEFTNLIGTESWRWIARPMGDGKFLLRFPTANMAQQWSRLKNLTLRNNAQVRIEAWSPAVGCKAILQSRWFRVTKIPTNQRSLMTLAKVGGLVGKVIAVDEESRYRYDYVRLKIACRNVAKVPRTAEGTLGMYVIDFGFEREVPEESGDKVLKSGIIVTDECPNKKSKCDGAPEGHAQGKN